MQEEPRWNQFLPEAIDEQIAQLKQDSMRDIAEGRLVRDLERAQRGKRNRPSSVFESD